MNLKQLEAFVQVAEGGSFSKAAKQLFLTQPTISAHISSLEKELNARFFVRNTKEVKLSDDGKELYRYARQMIDLQKKIEERFETGKSESKHLITIAASTIPAQYLLPEILMKFNERYPKEQVKLLETDSSQVVTKIIDHMVDVGFTGTVLEKKHCKYIPFYKDELIVITPNTEKYQVLHQNIEDISWISGECLIMREEGSGTRKEAGKQLRNAGINLDKLKIIASIENQETIKKSVKQGMGISIISRLAAEEEAKSGDLLTFPIPKADQGRDINLVYNKNYQMSKSAERFIKVVKEALLNSLSYLFDQKYEDLAAVIDPNLSCYDKLLFLNHELFYMIETSIDIHLLAYLYSSQLVTKDKKSLSDKKRIYFKWLTEIMEEGLKNGEFKNTSTASELMEIYAMYERALLYDWALFKGKFSLTERTDKLLPHVLQTFVDGL